MYPGGDSGQYEHGEGYPGVPGQPPPPNYPQSPYPYPQQPGYQQPTYQQPTYQQPTYQQAPHQPPPVFQPPPAYQPPGYPPYPPPPPKSQRSQVMLVAAVAVVAMLAVVGVAIYVVVNSGGKDNHDSGTPVAGGSASAGASPSNVTSKKNPAPGDGLAVGRGPVHVDVYVDYGCPPCSTFEEVAGDQLSQYLTSNKITLSIHPVVFIDERSKNKYSSRAAAAVAGANDGDKLLEYSNYLLQHQPQEDTTGPSNDELISDGRALGLGSDFASCVSGGQKASWVAQATTAAQTFGVSSVPAAYVNGEKTNATKQDVVSAVTSAS
jgi:protein-disulfide isomerase